MLKKTEKMEKPSEMCKKKKKSSKNAGSAKLHNGKRLLRREHSTEAMKCSGTFTPLPPILALTSPAFIAFKQNRYHSSCTENE